MKLRILKIINLIIITLVMIVFSGCGGGPTLVSFSLGNNFEGVKKEIAKGADIEMTAFGKTSLSYAMEKGNIKRCWEREKDILDNSLKNLLELFLKKEIS